MAEFALTPAANCSKLLTPVYFKANAQLNKITSFLSTTHGLPFSGTGSSAADLAQLRGFPVIQGKAHIITILTFFNYYWPP